jgi:hypothetical protein
VEEHASSQIYESKLFPLSKRVLRNLPLIFFGLALIVCFLPAPPILGSWELLTFFHSFGALDAPLTFVIHPLANIGGQGYALLDISRTIADFAGWSLSAFRLPALLSGLVFLTFFYIAAYRVADATSAAAATLLLALNPLFQIQIHSMTVGIVSAASFMILLERLSNWERRPDNAVAIAGLAVAIVLCALHYGPVRIMTAMIVPVSVLRHAIKSSDLRICLRGICGILFALGLSVLLLRLLDIRNIAALRDIQLFFFPPFNEVAKTGASITESVSVNSSILLDYLTGYGAEFHARKAASWLADFRYPLLDPITATLSALGLVIGLAYAFLNRRIVISQEFWWATLLAITLLPYLFSEVFTGAHGAPISSLSNHRVFFALIPLYIFVGVALKYLLGSDNRRLLLGSFGVLALAGWSAFGIISERQDLNHALVCADLSNDTAAARHAWANWAGGRDRTDERLDFFQNEARYRTLAKKIKMATERSRTKTTLAYIDVRRLPYSKTTYPFLRVFNVHSVELVLYVAEEGLNPRFVQMEGAPPQPDRISVTGYMGKPRSYGAEVRNVDGTMQYTLPVEQGFLRNTGKRNSRIVLATTPEELSVARKSLKEDGPVNEIVIDAFSNEDAGSLGACSS